MTRCLSVIPNEDALRLRRLAIDGESEICIERRRDGDIVFVMVNQAADGRFGFYRNETSYKQGTVWC
jgi:hypothetical protein